MLTATSAAAGFSVEEAFEVEYPVQDTLALLQDPSSWQMLMILVTHEEDDPALVNPSYGSKFFAGLREKKQHATDSDEVAYNIVFNVPGDRKSHEVTVTQRWTFTQLPGQRCRVRRQFYDFRGVEEDHAFRLERVVGFVRSVSEQQNAGIQQLAWIERESVAPPDVSTPSRTSDSSLGQLSPPPVKANGAGCSPSTLTLAGRAAPLLKQTRL